jgi:hypothetical protein
VYLLNRLPTKTISVVCPHVALFGSAPSYEYLRVFGCACYPNIAATAPHKLTPRSTRCVFLSYSADHKGYHCLDLSPNRLIVSRHVVFDEDSFPLAASPNLTDLDFLLESDSTVSTIRTRLPLAGSTTTAASPPALVVPPGFEPLVAPLPTPAVPPGFLPRAASIPTFVHAPGAATPTPVAPRATSAPHAATDGPPPREWPSSPIVYAKRPQQPALTAPMGPASTPLDQRPPTAVHVTPVVNPHWMLTRAKAGFRVLPDRLVLAASSSPSTPSPIPTFVHAALADPNWCAAMEDEYGALMSNGTWELVARPRGSNVVTDKWIFMHKLRADGSFDRYKARWVLRGFTQRPRVNYDETFSSVVKPATVRTVLATAVSRDSPVQQLDVKNAFLHDTLSETVFCSQPTGFANPAHPDLVCRLHKSLYGLKQAPRAWYSRFATYLLSLGFVEAKADTSLFIFRRGADTVYQLLYVDDIILTASSTTILRRTISALQREFTMKDLGPLHHFLGITVERRPDGMFLHQCTYTLDIIKRAAMADCKSCTTLVDLQAKLTIDSGPPVQDPSQFRSIAGALQYLTFTWPDIAYIVQQICLHMHDPREPHLTAMKRILRYLQWTPNYGLLLRRSSSSDLVVYTDADWAGCPDTRRSTSGYAVFLEDNLVSWSTTR